MREAVIEEFPRYSISDHGDVISYVRKKPRLMKPCQPSPDLMLRITLCAEPEPGALLAEGYTRFIHKLVAEAFVRNPHGLTVVEHIDGNYNNNYYKNLRWISRIECARNCCLRDMHDKATLSVRDVKKIKEALEKSKAATVDQWVSYRAKLARKFSVTAGVIYSIQTGFSWSYV